MQETKILPRHSSRTERTLRLSRRKFMGASLAAGVATSSALAGAKQDANASPGSAPQYPLANAIDQGTLVVADNLSAHWRTLDPAFLYEGNPCAALYLGYDTLYHSPDGEQPDKVVPLLASRMPEFSDDGLTATISLRDDVTFHGTGNMFTAADVIFSWNRLKNVGLQGSFLAKDYWTSLEASDDYKLVIRLDTPNANLAAVLTAPMLSITDRLAVAAAGGTDVEPSSEEDSPELQANLAAKEIIDRASVGSGPYVVEQFDTSGEVILVKREDPHWGDSVMFDRVIWRNTLDLNAQLQSVQLGEADIATAVNAEETSNLPGDVQVIRGQTLAIQYLALNLREEWSGPVAIKEVRRALAHAVDYAGIIEGLLLGNGLRPATALPLPLEGSEEALDLAILTDLEAAQASWDASGVGEATIQFDYASDGTGRGGVNYHSLAVKLKSDLERIDGVTIELAPMPNNQRTARHRAGEYQISLASWVPDFPGPDAYVTPFFKTDASASRRVSYSDPEVDQLIDQANAERDPEIRTQLYVEVQRRVIEACPYVVLYQPGDIKVANAGVSGAQVHPVYQLQLRTASKRV